MATSKLTVKRPSRIAVAAAERARCGATCVRLAETADVWAQRDARETARLVELETEIAYGKPATVTDAHTQLALVADLSEIIDDEHATPAHFDMAHVAFNSALAFLTA